MGGVGEAIIGGVIGFAVGGPVGAVIGAGAGYAEGNAAERQKDAIHKQTKAMQQQIADEQHAAEIANRQQQIIERQNRVQAIRKVRAATGTMVSQAAAAGVGSGSSSLEGGLSSLQSQLAGNIGTSQALSALEIERMTSLNDAAAAGSRAATAQGQYTAAGIDYRSYSDIGSSFMNAWTKMNTPKFRQSYGNSNIWGN